MSEVTKLLDKLAAGEVELADVVLDFSRRSWPSGPTKSSSYLEAEKRADADPEPFPKGSWAEVEAAYASGKITDRQYTALFHART